MFRVLLGSSVSIIAILIAYTFLGSLIFMYLEEKSSKTVTQDFLHFTEEEVEEIMKEVQKKMDVVKWTELKLKVDQMKKLKSENLINESVDIWKSLYFCFTIYTSIGYGNITPKTDSSRLFTCIYALIGIPLCLMALERIGRVLLWILKWVHKRAIGDSQNANETDSLPIFLLVFLIAAYIWAGSFIYGKNENWSLSESLYFLFISFTTIGFGDICPEDSKYFIVTISYQFIGLSLMATLINVLLSKIEEFILILSTSGKYKNE